MWLFARRCRCTPKVVGRRHDHWNAGIPFYGYVILLTVRAHTGQCPLHDEVLAARVVKIP